MKHTANKKQAQITEKSKKQKHGELSFPGMKWFPDMLALLMMLWVLMKHAVVAVTALLRLVTPISPILKHLKDTANASSGWFRIILCRMVSILTVCSLQALISVHSMLLFLRKCGVQKKSFV